MQHGDSFKVFESADLRGLVVLLLKILSDKTEFS